jgi:hypothetical protein
LASTNRSTTQWSAIQWVLMLVVLHSLTVATIL